MASALESAQFSELVYGGNPDLPVPPGWELHRKIDHSTGMYAEAYQNPSTGELLVVYRGTEPSDIGDLINGGQTLLDGLSDADIVGRQEGAAAEFLQQVIDETGASQVHVTGHSLGDQLSQAALNVTAGDEDFDHVQYAGMGFNGPGIGSAGDLPNVNYTHIDTRGDLIHNLGGEQLEGNEVTLSTGPGALQYGQSVLLGVVLGPATGLASAAKHALDAHRIKIIREYLEAHPNVGKIPAEARLTAEQIQQIREDPAGFVYFNDSSVDNEGEGEQAYEPDAIVGFDPETGEPVTAAQAGYPLVEGSTDDDALENSEWGGSGVGGGQAPNQLVSDGSSLNPNELLAQNAQQNLAQLQSSVDNLMAAIDSGDELAIVQSGLELLLTADNGFEGALGNQGFINAVMEDHLVDAHAVLSDVGSLLTALDQGGLGDQVGAAMELLQSLDEFDDDAEGWTDFTESQTVSLFKAARI